MAEEVNLLQELKSGNYQAAILGSFGVNFPFFEEVVLRTLRSHGCDHNVLLVDGAECASALTDPELAPRGAGRLYGLVPVVAPGAFHPKFMLLLGKRQSKLVLGSHNLTLSGFGLNREVSNVLCINDPVSVGLGQSVYRLAIEWSATVGAEMSELVEAAKSWAPWLGSIGTTDANLTVLGVLPTGPCLWDQLRPRIVGNVRRITIIGPYFDERLQFLHTLREEYSEAEIVVGVSPRYSKINPVSATSCEGVVFKDISGWIGDSIARLVHGKLLHFEYSSGESILVSGSANPSAPAWLDVGRRNAELVLVRTLAKEDTLSKDLGLHFLFECADMTITAWDAVRDRLCASDVSVKPQARAWVAFEQDEGFLVNRAFCQGARDIAVLSRDGDVLAQAPTPSGDSERCLLRVDDDAIRDASFSLRCELGSRTQLALVQHLPELRERATSAKNRSLRQALLDLKTSEDGIDGYLAVIEKAIFDEEPTPKYSARVRNVEPRETRVETIGAVTVGNLQTKRLHRLRLSGGDIALVLDALIHKLGEGLPTEKPAAARLSEEDINDDTEVPYQPIGLDEGRLLAQRCRNKTRKLMQRMVKRLELAWNDEADPFAIVLQTVATIGLLRCIRERQPNLAWLPHGEDLIEPEWQEHLYRESVVTIFAPANGVTEGLLEKFGQFSELSSAAGLVLWAAWSLGVDLTTALIATSAFDDKEESDVAERQRQNLFNVGLLLNCLNRDLLPPLNELEAIFGDDGLVWVERHVSWAENVMTAPPTVERLDAGSVVEFQRTGKADVGVVLSVNEGKVEVVDRETGESLTYTTGRVHGVGAV